MTDTVKKSLKSASILAAIAVIAVAILVAANALFPKYQPKLDLAKVTKLNALVSVGVDNQTALDEGYFRILASEEKTDEFDVVKLNKEMRNKNLRTSNDSLLAIYKVELGDKKDSLIIETTTRGYSSQDTLLWIAFDKDGVVTAVTAEYSPSDYYLTLESNNYYYKLNELLVGKSAKDSFNIMKSGATESSNAVDFGVKLAFEAVNQLIGGAN